MLEDTNANRRAIANICYTTQRNRRRIYPRFLRRNLRRILDSHQRLLPTSTPDDLCHQDMVANQHRPWGWDFPTTDMLRDYMSGRQPVLQIERMQLRTKRTNTTISESIRESTDRPGPDWLVDPFYNGIRQCVVGIQISIPKDAQNSKRQIHHESLSGTILECDRPGKDAEDTYFDIKLDNPFFFKVDKLFVVTESGTNGSRSWKRTVNAPYVLDVSVQCQDYHESLKFLSVLEGRHVSHYHGQDTPSSETILRSTWSELPNCPNDGQLLPVRRAKGHKSLDLDYKLEIAMGWINRRDYVLKAYNRVYTQEETPVRQLPTPSSSDDADRQLKSYNISWNFHDGTVTRSMTIMALTCALCQDERHYSCFSYLMLHCKRDHDHFTFSFKDTIDGEDTAAFNGTILMRAAPPQHEKPGGTEDDEMNWVAPDRPFDLKAYLRGEDSWTGQVRPKNKKGIARPIRERDAPVSASALPPRKRPALEDVEDLPKHLPKKHRVPNAPGVTFYRTTSKQPIHPGTFIAESDDEIDESWLAQNQSRALDDLGVSGEAKVFTQALNHHLAREQSNSSVLTREALVRFTRSHLDELADPQWQRLFAAKLRQLRSAGIIDHDVITHCERLIEQAQNRNGEHSKTSTKDGDTLMADAEATRLPNAESSDRVSNAGRSTSGEAHSRSSGKAALRADKELTPASCTQRHSTSAKRCICGDFVREMRGSIACADEGCTRRDFHLSCLGLERRMPGWRCMECSRNSSSA